MHEMVGQHHRRVAELFDLADGLHELIPSLRAADYRREPNRPHGGNCHKGRSMERIQDDGMEHAADPDLVRDAKRGDEAAFTALLRPLLEPAYRLATGMLQDRQLAEDAGQEAAGKAWREINPLREGSERGPWFLGIVANECRTTQRGRWWGALKTGAEQRGGEAPDDAAVRGI